MFTPWVIKKDGINKYFKRVKKNLIILKKQLLFSSMSYLDIFLASLPGHRECSIFPGHLQEMQYRLAIFTSKGKKGLYLKFSLWHFQQWTQRLPSLSAGGRINRWFIDCRIYLCIYYIYMPPSHSEKRLWVDTILLPKPNKACANKTYFNFCWSLEMEKDTFSSESVLWHQAHLI